MIFANWRGGSTESAPMLGATATGGREVDIRGLSHGFVRGGTSTLALNQIDLHVTPGDFTAILGPSGCGKTTLLNVVSGLIKPSHGVALVGGEAPRVGSPDVGFLFARDSLLPWRTAVDNIALPLEARGVPRHEREERAMELLVAVGLEGYAGAFPSELSHGMRQRVAIARTLIIEPALILMDEPFSALDAQTRLRLHEVFLALWERRRCTVLLITHDIAEAITLADEVVVFSSRPGEIRAKVRVEFERPRRVMDLQRDRDYHDLFQSIWSVFEQQLESR